MIKTLPRSGGRLLVSAGEENAGLVDLGDGLGGGTGYELQTESDFDQALKNAWEDDTATSLIQVHPSVTDRSRTLERLGAAVQAAGSGRDPGQTQS